MQYIFDFFKKNFIYLLAGIAIIFALVTFVYIQITPRPIPTPTPAIPVFSPSPTQKPADLRPVPGEKYQTISETDQEQIRRDTLVNQLIKRLPFTGTNFSLSYDYSTIQFTLTLKTGQEDQGQEEFDAFLQTNQIQNRSWLKDFIVKSQ